MIGLECRLEDAEVGVLQHGDRVYRHLAGRCDEFTVSGRATLDRKLRWEVWAQRTRPNGDLETLRISCKRDHVHRGEPCRPQTPRGPIEVLQTGGMTEPAGAPGEPIDWSALLERLNEMCAQSENHRANEGEALRAFLAALYAADLEQLAEAIYFATDAP